MGIRQIALGFLILAMLAVIVLTWGSLGSMALCYGLIIVVSALLYRRFLDREDCGDYSDFQ